MYWFPKFNSRGDLLYEDGKGNILLNGVEKVVGNRPCWLTDTRWVYTVNNGATFEFGVSAAIWPSEVHELAAGGGHWAGVAQGQLVIDGALTGIAGGQPFYSLTGELIYKTSDHDYEPTILGNLRAWKDGSSVVTNFGLGPFKGEGYPRLIPGPWLLTMTNNGLRIRGLDSLGWEKITGENNNFNPAGYNNGTELKIAHSGGMWTQPLAEPRRNLDGPVVIIPHNDAPHTDAPPAMSIPDKRQETSSFLAPRLKKLATPDETRNHSFEQLNALCAQLAKADPRWGILEKKSGARVKDRASDVLVYRISDSEARVVDVIADAEGINGTPRPTWIAKDARPINQWKQPFPVEGEEPVPSPEDPKPVPEDFKQALAQLKAELERQFEAERKERQGLKEILESKLAGMETKLETLRNRKLRVNGSTGDKAFHKHAITLMVEEIE